MNNILFTPNAAYSPITSWSSPIHGSLQVDWDSAQDFPWLALSPKGNIRSFTNAINLSENDAFIGYQREGDDTFLVDWAVRDSSGNLRKKVTLQPNIQEEFSERLSRGAIASDGSLYLLFQGRTLINYDSQGKEIRRFAAPLNHRYQDIAIDSAGDLYVSGYKSVRSPGPDTPFLEKRSGANGEIVWTSTPIKDRDTNNFNGNVRLSSNAIAILSDGTVLQTISGHPFGINESSGLYIMRINGSDGSLQAIVKIDNDASYFSNALFAQNNSIILRTAQGAYSILLDAQPVAFSSELTPIIGLNHASTEDSGLHNIAGLNTIAPSTRQVNEGDSLNTTLSGFTPNSTQFFSVTGRGINKKDFSAGAVKGSVRVDGSGVATISHTLRADKATEGEESFSVQVFSDKRMRNSLGQSDAVTVFDTSVKTSKVGKPPKGGGGESTTNNDFRFKHPLTGQTIATDTVNTGFFPPGTGKNQSYKDGQYEIEMNRSTIILTLRADNWIGADPKPGRFDVSRAVITGKFETDKNGLLSGMADRITSFNVQSDPQVGFFMETAQSYILAKDTKASNDFLLSTNDITSATFFYSNLDANEYDYNGNIVGNSFNDDGDMRFLNTPLYQDRNRLRGLPDTSLFQEGWWQDPFTPNLI